MEEMLQVVSTTEGQEYQIVHRSILKFLRAGGPRATSPVRSRKGFSTPRGDAGGGVPR